MEAVMENIVIEAIVMEAIVMEAIVKEAIVKENVRWKELLSVACPSSLSTHTT